MKVYDTEHIRNLAVIGHGDAGKTQLISSLLHVAGATSRWGKVDEGTTVTDHDEDSIARKITLNTALAHLEHKDTKVNLIDRPGYAAFVSHARPAARVADCGIVVVDGVKGVEVQTEKVWNYANEFMLPRMMVVTKLDKEHAEMGIALDSAHNVFKRAIVPFTLPIGKEHNFKGVVDVVHMKAYEFDPERGKAKEIDIPAAGRDVVDKTRERTIDDPFAGRINVFKVISGKVGTDATVYNSTRSAAERLGALHTIQGKQLDKVPEANAGDIIACVKLKETQTGDTMCDKAHQIVYDPVQYPEAAIAFAIEPKSRQDEEKISVAIHKILEEDPALSFTRDSQTKEFLLAGSGQVHVETIVDKLKKRYNVEVMLHPPKVPYKQTITQRAEVQGRHKKQTGGRGQFGDCKVVFEPLPRGSGFTFEDKIFGGSVPQQFRPAIEKGIVEAASHGAIAGYPLVDFKVQLIDGSYHNVDSDEHSFRAAGRKAFRNATEKVKPTLLEPIMDVEITAPQECSGDIMGDLNSRRGRVQGMDTWGKNQVIKAQVPMAEMLNYQSTLNSITAARGSFHMQFSHYDPVPGQLAQKIVQQAKAEGRIRAAEEE